MRDLDGWRGLSAATNALGETCMVMDDQPEPGLDLLVVDDLQYPSFETWEDGSI